MHSWGLEKFVIVKEMTSNVKSSYPSNFKWLKINHKFNKLSLREFFLHVSQFVIWSQLCEWLFICPPPSIIMAKLIKNGQRATSKDWQHDWTEQGLLLPSDQEFTKDIFDLSGDDNSSFVDYLIMHLWTQGMRLILVFWLLLNH